MVQTQNKSRPERGHLAFVTSFQQSQHMLIHIASIGKRLLNRRTRDQATPGPAMARPQRVVIGVKEIRILRMQRLIIRDKLLEQKRLKEPAHMRQVPLRRADIRHRLHHIVLSHQWLAQLLSELAHLQIAFPQLLLSWSRRSRNLFASEHHQDNSSSLYASRRKAHAI